MVDILVNPVGMEEWEGNLVGTPMEQTLKTIKDYSTGSRKDFNRLFGTQEQFEREKADNTAVHAWTIAADWLNYEKAIDNISQLRKSTEAAEEIAEHMRAEIARMIVPHIDDVEFMKIVSSRAKDLLGIQ